MRSRLFSCVLLDVFLLAEFSTNLVDDNKLAGSDRCARLKQHAWTAKEAYATQRLSRCSLVQMEARADGNILLQGVFNVQKIQVPATGEAPA